MGKKKHPLNKHNVAKQEPAKPVNTSKPPSSFPVTMSQSTASVSPNTSVNALAFPREPTESSIESTSPVTPSSDVLASVKSSLQKRLDTDTEERARKTSTGSITTPRKLQKVNHQERRPSTSTSCYSPSIKSVSEDTPRSVRESETDTVAEPVSPTVTKELELKPFDKPETHEEHSAVQVIVTDDDTTQSVLNNEGSPAKEEAIHLPRLSLPLVPLSASAPSIANSALEIYYCGSTNGSLDQGSDATCKPTMTAIVGHLTMWPLHTTLAVASQLPMIGDLLPHSPLTPRPGDKGGVISTTELAIKTGVGLVVAGGWSVAGWFLPNCAPA